MILMKNIIREGHPNLTKVSSPVTFPLSNDDLKLAKSLLEYVINSQDEELVKKYNLRPSVGLAAVQVNKLKRMFAMHVVDLDDVLYSYVFINPVINTKSNNITYIPGGEGCLSVDRQTTGLTPRANEINVSGYFLDLATNTVKPINLNLKGYPAIVFQHEYDHLNGILYTTKLYPSLPNALPAFELEEE